MADDALIQTDALSQFAFDDYDEGCPSGIVGRGVGGCRAVGARRGVDRLGCGVGLFPRLPTALASVGGLGLALATVAGLAVWYGVGEKYTAVAALSIDMQQQNVLAGRSARWTATASRSSRIRRRRA